MSGIQAIDGCFRPCGLAYEVGALAHVNAAFNHNKRFDVSYSGPQRECMINANAVQVPTLGPPNINPLELR